MVGYNTSLVGERLSSMFNIIVGAVLPFVVILGCNVVIIYHIKSASRERAKLGKHTEREQKDHYITAMLAFVSAAYIITTLPYRLFSPVLKIPQVAAIYDLSQRYWRLRFGISGFSVINIWFCNHAVNFYLYCIGGGRKYRNDTKELIHQLFPCVSKRGQE
jgi:hypothetical protein